MAHKSGRAGPVNQSRWKRMRAMKRSRWAIRSTCQPTEGNYDGGLEGAKHMTVPRVKTVPLTPSAIQKPLKPGQSTGKKTKKDKPIRSHRP
jgi:hypothetical protein